MINYSLGGWVLFALQFFWQFPHFWAIAWVAHKDYSAAGFKLLPSREGPTKFTALQTVIYSLLLVPVTVAPYFIGMCTYENTSGKVGLGLDHFGQHLSDLTLCYVVWENGCRLRQGK